MGFILVSTNAPYEIKCSHPLLFINKECVDNRNNGVLLDPIIMTQSEKKIANDTINQLFCALLGSLTTKLNLHHRVNFSERYWGILIGHWLYRYISIMFNRYHSIKKAFELFEISGYAVLKKHENIIAQNSQEFVLNTSSPEWNHQIFTEIILRLCEFRDFRDELISIPINSNVDTKVLAATNQHVAWSFKKFFLRNLSKLSLLFAVNEDAVIVNSYLPRKEEVKLFLWFKQVPHFWHAPHLDFFAPDNELRSKLFKREKCINHQSEFSYVLNLSLWNVIPVCFLEGFDNLRQFSLRQNLPKRPKFIFTSNNFDTDEVFKAWTAEKTERGVKYCVGQHGNNYGTHYALGRETMPERKFSSKFITWGWDDGVANNIVGFNFKIAGQTKVLNLNGGLLLVQESRENMIWPYDVSADNLRYMKNQFSFVNTLLPDIKNSTCVRLCADNVLNKKRLDLEWNHNFPDVSIDLGVKPISKLINKSRLVVYSYDSTGILESMGLNIPTIAFWSGNLDHLLEDAKPYYQSLVDTRILHFSPIEAAEMINEVWSDIPAWWYSKDVQSARNSFISKYSKVVRDPVRRLGNILVNI